MRAERTRQPGGVESGTTRYLVRFTEASARAFEPFECEAADLVDVGMRVAERTSGGGAFECEIGDDSGAVRHLWSTPALVTFTFEPLPD